MPLDAHVLDAACGSGLTGAALRDLGYAHIDGIDISPALLDLAERTGAYERLQRVDMQAFPLPFDDDSYDAVNFIGALTYFDTNEVLRELCRIVRPGGVVAFSQRDDIMRERAYDGQLRELDLRPTAGVIGGQLSQHIGRVAVGRLAAVQALATHAVDVLRDHDRVVDQQTDREHQPQERQDIGDDQRLEDVKLEMSLGAADRDGDMVAHDLGADHGQGLGLGGIDLSRHDGGPGLIGRQQQFADPAPGAGPQQADIIGDFHQ